MTATYLTKMAHTPFNPELKYETARLASFQNWRSIDRASPIILAKAGFAYTGNDDVVKCSSCNFTKEHWNRHMDPMRIHRENSPNCSFILGSEEANVPIAVPETTRYREILERLHNQYCGANAPMTVGMNFSRQTSNSDDSGPMERQNLQVATQTNFPVVATDSGSAETSSQAIGVRGALGRNQASPETQRREELSPMKQESNRFSSFVGGWPRHGTPDPRDLARAGFYYTGTVDRVQCVFCRGILRNWDEDDVPMDEHRRHFPMCPFVMGMDVGNIPDPSVIVSDNNSNSTVHITGTEAVVTDSVLGNVTERPKHPQYVLESSRISSFTNWPSEKAQTPAELAKAGFFHTGSGDKVKCFLCDGGLYSWERGDDPWMVHARCFPRCPYVRQVKGEDFIKQSMEEKRSTTSSGSRFRKGSTPSSDEAVHQTVSGENNANSGSSPTIPNLCQAALHMPPPQEDQARLNQQPQDVMTLRKENEEMKEFKLCKLCMKRDRVWVFLPCGHLILCEKCGPSVRLCPMCRAEVINHVIAKFAPSL